ncbi:MAG: hypothetical protein L3J35_01290 [Bacteroidales bacterium]|nr:hypothetical protein [Bacteroidales bacterium]
MKKIIQYTAMVLFICTVSLSTAFAQAPEKMSYQAVIRDASNNLVISQSVGMQISILQSSETGTEVYVETQNPTTNTNGLVSIEIGTGTVVSGDFTTIDWANDTYFVKTETDPTGGTNYTITGTSQLLSVPYALHAKTAENITGTVSYTETDPIFGASIANGITAADTANWNNHTIDTDTHIDSAGIAGLGYVAGAHTVDTDTHIDSAGIAVFGYVAGGITAEADGDPTNEIQTISKPGPSPVVYLSNGGGSFVDAVNDADADPLNELQTISRILDIVTLSNTGGSFSVNDVDADPLNELQDISLSGNSLSISSGSTLDLSGIGFDGDFNNLTNVPVNLDTNFTDDFDGQYSSLTGVPTNVSVFTNDAGYLTSFSETDPAFTAAPAFGITNTLMTNWSTAYSWGNHAAQGYLTSFIEVDGDSTNEIQNLSISGNNLSISGTGGNTVALPTSSSPWTISGSDIYRASGNVGIGTTTPSTVVEVADNFPLFSLTDNDNLETDGNYQSYFQGLDMAGTETWYVGEGSTGKLVGLMASRPNYDLFLGTNSIEQMTIKADGKTGIGTTTPLTTLDVDGDIRGTSFKLGNTTTIGNYFHVGFNANGTDTDIKYGSGLIAFIPGGSSNIPLALNNTGDALMALGSSNVGIGTFSPTEKLEVSGSVKITDGTEGAGKVLTSDANGKASWVTPTTTGGTGGLVSQGGEVRRDFITFNTTDNTANPIHIKTNIPEYSNTMYRILVEGYAYGVSAVINSDVAGYTFGSTAGISNPSANNYASGVSISQYISSDGFVVVKLTTTYNYYLGFSASAWFVNPTGTNFPISATAVVSATNL